MNDNKLIKMKQSYASIKKEFHLWSFYDVYTSTLFLQCFFRYY